MGKAFDKIRTGLEAAIAHARGDETKAIVHTPGEVMKTLRFEGYSDDTFSCEGKGIDVDYDNCASGEPIHMKVIGAGGCVIVTGQYCQGPSQGWGISVAPGADDPDEGMPEWPMRFVSAERTYSAALVIDAPDDVRVSLVDAA